MQNVGASKLFGQSSRTTRDASLTSEIFLLRVGAVVVLAVVVLAVVVVASGGQETDPGLGQQVLQLTAQQVQQRLHHLCAQLVGVSPAVQQTKRRHQRGRCRLTALDIRGWRPLPGADGQDLQQARGRHLQGCAQLGHAWLVKQLQRLAQHGLRPAQLGQNAEQAAGDGQGDVHRLVANAEREHRHQQEALLGFWMEAKEEGCCFLAFERIHSEVSTKGAQWLFLLPMWCLFACSAHSSVTDSCW